MSRGVLGKKGLEVGNFVRKTGTGGMEELPIMFDFVLLGI